MRRILLALVLLTLTSTCSVSASAQGPAQDSNVPSYLILQPPAQVHKGKAYYPGRGYAVKPQAYAYGWFGAQPRDHWRRQTGYGAAYIQWKRF